MSDNMKEIINVKIMGLLETKNSKFVKADREYLKSVLTGEYKYQ